jgi:hypothetical protein
MKRANGNQSIWKHLAGKERDVWLIAKAENVGMKASESNKA